MNLYFQDESRFGLKTHMGSCVCAKGVRPVVPYQHRFRSTYIFGSYSPLDGSSLVWEVDGVSKDIFHAYLRELSAFRPREFKVVVIDNAGFHSVRDMDVPENIFLLNIPPYCPELNPCEQVWAHMKKLFKNRVFPDMESLREWLRDTVCSMTPETIRSITSNHHYQTSFNAAFQC